MQYNLCMRFEMHSLMSMSLVKYHHQKINIHIFIKEKNKDFYCILRAKIKLKKTKKKEKNTTNLLAIFKMG